MGVIVLHGLKNNTMETSLEHILLEKRILMRGASTICSVMFGNGARIGGDFIPTSRQPILKALLRNASVFCAGATGEPVRVTAALLIAAGIDLTRPPTTMAYMASASLAPHYRSNNTGSKPERGAKSRENGAAALQRASQKFPMINNIRLLALSPCE